ncbi:hypothetical protein Tco_0657862 [Tanacetum coccineum]
MISSNTSYLEDPIRHTGKRSSNIPEYYNHGAQSKLPNTPYETPLIGRIDLFSEEQKNVTKELQVTRKLLLIPLGEGGGKKNKKKNNSNDSPIDNVMESADGDELNEVLGTSPDTSAPKAVNEGGMNELGTRPATPSLNPGQSSSYTDVTSKSCIIEKDKISHVVNTTESYLPLPTHVASSIGNALDDNLLKEDVSTILVWVKLHGVLVMAFSEDGLSAIVTKLGKLRFVDDDGNPLVPMSIEDSDSEMEVVFDETPNLRISTSGKEGSDKGYGTNSLLEQWRDSYPDNDDYDMYDDDMYKNHDMSEYPQSICNDLDITVRGRKKK